jgi:phospholipid/cholesterol/gamma-HCH transport system permease protein
MAEALLIDTSEGDSLRLAAAGAWTLQNIHVIERQIATAEQQIATAATRHGAAKRVAIDMGAVERLDTFGAWLLQKLVRGFATRGCATEITGLNQDYRALFDELNRVQPSMPQRRRGNPLIGWLESIGRAVVSAGESFTAMLNMLGALAVALVRVVLEPRRFRLTALVHQLDNVGWRAVPIMLLITFLIGCIIAQQGIFHFGKFGADIYVVDMVGVLVLREIGVLIVCIMVAGRSGSAYTAEIGSMKMREEIDALRTMGFDPIEVLCLPRVLALIVAVPILTFLGSLAALYGGGLVAWAYGGIEPDVFLQRLREAITLDTFKVGMIKAPFMALVVGVVACVQGMNVKGSAESLGLQTTASVVESIFLVIVMDGLFAIFFASIGM